MDKNDIYLGSTSKQDVPFSENLPLEKCTHTANIRAGPGLIFFGC